MTKKLVKGLKTIRSRSSNKSCFDVWKIACFLLLLAPPIRQWPKSREFKESVFGISTTLRSVPISAQRI